MWSANFDTSRVIHPGKGQLKMVLFAAFRFFLGFIVVGVPVVGFMGDLDLNLIPN